MYLDRNVKDVKPKCMLCKNYVVSSSQEVTCESSLHYGCGMYGNPEYDFK
jgi:hypothetical protein